jgi:hypothetical protein
MKVARFFLVLNGVVLAAYAASFFVKPRLLGELVGFQITSPNALVEITAFYGGLELGLAAFLIWSALQPPRFLFALAFFFLTFFCAGTARFLGLALYGCEGSSQLVVASIEVSMALLALWLNRRLSTGR